MNLGKKKNQAPLTSDPQALAAMQQRADANSGRSGKGKLSVLGKAKAKNQNSDVSNRNLFGKEKSVKNANYKGKFSASAGARKSLKTVISIDANEKAIKFLSTKGENGKISISSRSFETRLFDKEFFTVFKGLLGEYAKSHVAYTGKSATAVLLLPDGYILSDCISVPAVNSAKRDKLVRLSIDSRYKNAANLSVHYFPVSGSKQSSTFEISAMNQEFHQMLSTSCSGNNMFADVITYAGNATVNGFLANNSKLKADNFVLTDIKENVTRLCYVVHGSCMGSVTLPFGYSILRSNHVVAENMLFDHTAAELAVLNAKEKAKAKQGTVIATTTQIDEDLAEGVEAFGGTTDVAARNAIVYKTLPKKTPRVLPKFMQRPEPETEEDLRYENFRVFEKYILEYIRSNRMLAAGENPSAVYVNMPAEFTGLLEKTNAASDENGVMFKAAELGKLDATTRENLEMYGGLVSAKFNLQNNF